MSGAERINKAERLVSASPPFPLTIPLLIFCPYFSDMHPVLIIDEFV